VPPDQIQRVEHRPVGGVVRPELQHVQQLNQPAPVVVGVRGPQRGLHGAPVHRPLGPELVHQLAQRLLPAGHRRIDHLPDRIVWPGQRCLGDAEQDVLLAGDPFERVHQFLGDSAVCAGANAVHGGDQQLDQGVGDLPQPVVQQRRQQRQHQRLGVVPQVRRGLHRRPDLPRRDHARGDVGEQPGRQVDRADRAQLADLGEHRIQADVARHRLADREGLDQRQYRLLTRVVVRNLSRGQRPQPHNNLGGNPPGDPHCQCLLRGPQRRPDDPIDPAPGRRLDPLGAAPREQLVAHQLGPALGLAHVDSQPLRQLLRIPDRALPKAQVRPYLSPVVLDRPAGPLVEGQLVRVHVDLPGHELDRLARQLPAAAREPAHPRVELQQKCEPQPCRTSLASDQLPLVVQQRPVLNQLVQIHRSGHGRSSCRTPARRAAPSNRPRHAPRKIIAVCGW
jgi:hypothetical protein